MNKFSPAKFVREVRQESAKVTWPTWGETRTTTLMVFAMVIVSAIFFFLVDQLLAKIVQLVLDLGT